MKTTEHSSTVSSSIFGFVLSLLLTVAAYVIVAQKLMSGWLLMASITVLALLQLYVQFTFFLHIGINASAKLRTMFLLFTLSTVAILVFGSIWIMNNLNYNMMNSPHTADDIVHDELINK